MMRMIRKKSLVATMALLGALCIPFAASAQTKVGTIDFRLALQQTAEFKKAVQGLEAEFKPRQDELQQLSQDLASIQQQLQGQPQNGAELQAEGEEKQRQAQRLNEDLQADLKYEQDDLLRGAATRMREVIAKIAQEKSLDVVISGAALVDPFEGRLMYLSPTIDLTAAATAAYDLAYPAQ